MKIEYRYGIFCGTGLCLWVLAEFAAGFHTTALEIGQYSGYGSIIIPLAVIYTAMQEHQRFTGSLLSVRSGINIGFPVAIISALIFTLFMYLYNNYINPGWIDAMVEWQRRKLILSGASDDAIEEFMNHNRRMNNTIGQGVMSFVSTTGMGVVITLLEIPAVRYLKNIRSSNN